MHRLQVVPRTLAVLAFAPVLAAGTGITALGWSRDGRSLAFETTSGRTTSLWRVGVGGTELRRVSMSVNGSLPFAWSPTGDTLYFASSPPFAKQSSVSALGPTGVAHVLRRVAGSATGLASGGAYLAVATTTYEHPSGCAASLLELVPTGGGVSRVISQSKLDAFDLVGFSPDRRWLLYIVDPQSSQSIAADGLKYRSYSVGSRSSRASGVGLTDSGWQSWAAHDRSSRSHSAARLRDRRGSGRSKRLREGGAPIGHLGPARK